MLCELSVSLWSLLCLDYCWVHFCVFVLLEPNWYGAEIICFELLNEAPSVKNHLLWGTTLIAVRVVILDLKVHSSNASNIATER